MVFGAVIAAALGFLIRHPRAAPQWRLPAIVTLAFGEIIKSIITNVYLGVDETASSSASSPTKTSWPTAGVELIRGPHGA